MTIRPPGIHVEDIMISLQLPANVELSRVTRVLIYTNHKEDAEKLHFYILTKMPQYVQGLENYDEDVWNHRFPIIRIGFKGVDIWELVIWCTRDLMGFDRERTRRWSFDRVYVYKAVSEQAMYYIRLEALRRVTDEATGLVYWKLPEGSKGTLAWPHFGYMRR